MSTNNLRPSRVKAEAEFAGMVTRAVPIFLFGIAFSYKQIIDWCSNSAVSSDDETEFYTQQNFTDELYGIDVCSIATDVIGKASDFVEV